MTWWCCWRVVQWRNWLNWCGSRLLTWWVTWIQRAGVADDVARLINFASNVFCASILFAEFPSCCCWRRGVTADLWYYCWGVARAERISEGVIVAGAAGWYKRLKTNLLWRQQLGVALWDSCGAKWWLLEVRLADGGERMSWLMSRRRWRSSVAGVGDMLRLRLLSVLVGDGGVGYDYCNRRWLVMVAAAAGGG
jgi:hypothetical protein